MDGNQKRVCRVCGCDDEHACLIPQEGADSGHCEWVADDLCSACDGRLSREDENRVIMYQIGALIDRLDVSICTSSWWALHANLADIDDIRASALRQARDGLMQAARALGMF